MADLIELKDDALAEALCRCLEPSPPVITARQARATVRNWTWVSCHDYYSPGGWWVAEIGTDHEGGDDSPVRWRPLMDVLDSMDAVWRAVEELKSRGWLVSILEMTDGWVVNGKRYDVRGGDWPSSVLTGDMVQEVGDTAPEAIARAAIAALSLPPTPAAWTGP